MANAMASVRPTPLKCHEAAAMALAGCVTLTTANFAVVGVIVDVAVVKERRGTYVIRWHIFLKDQRPSSKTKDLRSKTKDLKEKRVVLLMKRDGRDSAIQPSAAELVRTPLGSVARCLHNTLEIIEPAATSTSTPEEEQAAFATLAQSIQKERKALQLRRALVTRRLAVCKEKEDAADVKAADAERYVAQSVDKGIIKAADTQAIATLDTEGLIGMQVAQLEKEKEELNKSLRIVAKRVDHIERANRKEERPLLALDYEQVADRATFVALQRMVGEYEKRRGEVIKKQGKEYAKRKDTAGRKIEEEKAKRRKAVAAKREEERKAVEEAKWRDKDIQLTLN
ncbi:hypothetical protein K438DRAFT_1965545 [Mycena galopus ATCC 62051]|nr:hypothetical protein K438DRAFT_1965545 [Mycena galopus ATCC 62051]